MSFTHLHVHSEYSLLDGLARVPDLVRTAKDRGFDALALTDHGVMYGAIRFYQEANAVGIKPILGCELYVAKRTRHDRDSKLDRRSYHLTALAANETGYRNLLELVSRAQLEGFYYRPRVDHELLEQHSDGLIILSGCPSAEIADYILTGQLDKARKSLAWHRDVFGERFFVEVQNHDLDFIPELNRHLVGMARDMDLPLVATNDVHYALPTDTHAHEVLLCVQTGTTMVDPNRMRIGDSFYLRTEDEMRALFPDLPEAIDNTSLIADMCEVELTFNQYKLPRFDVPEGETAQTYLRRMCEAGLGDRYPTVTSEIRERLDYELEIIHGMGFDDYFLIVWDLCRHARRQGIWWNVRGSGAGSIVAYVLGVTSIDPIAHNLIFERFLNPSRVSMPDIDLDFPDDQRDDLIRYTFDKYGHDRVAQIITFGTLGARAAIRDAGRALDMQLDLVDQVARIVPAIPGKPCGIDDVLREPGQDRDSANEFYRGELAELYGKNDEVRHLIDTARAIEGVTRHASTHAAGVVIADRPLVEYVPLHRPTHAAADEQPPLPVTQFAMKDVDRLGLLKVDFLGLSTLTVLRRAAELIELNHGVRYTLDNIPLDDPSIYELLSSGNVTGVFQVEGAGMRKMLRQMKPQQFEHVVAAVALYRPGPMDYIPAYIARLHGDEEITYRHPLLEQILAETYGICVYQEQIIRIARDLAGYNAGEADTIRKAVGKKIKEKLLRHREKFVEGAVSNGIPKKTAGELFDDIETFARYGFNKAHAADYAVIV
ncbi:MAG: DNA polymerase III subunit alpha, partial [Anaerolineae bacterium]